MRRRFPRPSTNSEALPATGSRTMVLAVVCVLGAALWVVGCSTRTPVGAASVSKTAKCVVPPRPRASISLRPVFEGLQFQAPVALVQAARRAGEPSGRWFLADQHGEVVSFHSQQKPGSAVSGVVRTSLSDRVDFRREGLDERGLLGLALHPKFPEDPRLFVTYTANAGGLVSRVSSFIVQDGALLPGSEVVLLSVPQPYTNHNGGGIAFGPDGFLYTSFGDGGFRDDPHSNGQSLQTLLGALLRIDVDRVPEPLVGDARHYSIPSDNPFARGGGAPEIYAYGLRNPWRFSFDRETSRLWLGDVGQDTWEEVDIIDKGGNYGWNRKEGFSCFPPNLTQCEGEGLRDPVFVHRHPDGDGGGRSITGGFVYRGAELPELSGAYVYGDYSTGEIWQLGPRGEEFENRLLSNSGANISSFAEDVSGELYVLDWGGSRVLRISAAEDGPEQYPRLLSETGCVDVKTKTPLERAVPYQVNVPFWSDGAEKQRFLVLPKDQQLTLSSAEDGDLVLPRGGMAIKLFELGGEPLEVRFFARHEDGEYSGYTYAWRADGSDAELVETTRIEQRADQPWVFPGPEACSQCHTAAAGRTLGLSLPQLARQVEQEPRLVEVLEPAARRWLERIPESHRPFARLNESAPASIEVEARAYLDVNCSGCHRPGGTGRVGLDLRFATPLAETGLCEPATLGPVGDSSAMRLLPGSGASSVLHQRITRRDEAGMPPLASLKVDSKGAMLLASWIDGLRDCR